MTTEHHPNDMSAWETIGCRRGCDEHATRQVWVDLGGSTGYRDLTSIPDRFSTEFVLEIWDTAKTPVDGGPYCPARDAVSETILSHGVWEPQETVVLLNCFEALGPEAWFIDFGSQVGWFSTLAAIAGLNVLAIDADPWCSDLTRRNLDANKIDGRYAYAVPARVRPEDAPFDPTAWGDLPIVAKIDIEGAEAEAIRMLQPLIDARQVPYLLIEISPVFHEGYGALVRHLYESGYIAYNLPPKQQPPIQIDTLADLKLCVMTGTLDEIEAEVDSWHQRDLLFVLGGID